MKFFIICILFLTSIIPLFSQEVTQNIRGTVIEKETRSELYGAIVSVDGVENAITTSTDAKGNFRLTGVSIGRHTVKVKYIGYYDLVMNNIIVNAGKETILTIEMVDFW